MRRFSDLVVKAFSSQIPDWKFLDIKLWPVVVDERARDIDFSNSLSQNLVHFLVASDSLDAPLEDAPRAWSQVTGVCSSALIVQTVSNRFFNPAIDHFGS